MVNEEKLRIMTQIALDETKRHKTEIKEGGYYKLDYIRAHIFVNVASLEYDRLGFIVLGIYVGILVLGILFSYFHFKKEYAKNLFILKGYYTNLKKLDEFYTQNQNKEETGDDTIIGV